MFSWDWPDQPCPETFSDPIVRVVGRTCDFQPGVVVKRSTATLDRVLEEAGVDPLRPPWPLYAQTVPGLYEIVDRAASQMPKVLEAQDVGWSLTARGVDHAIELLGGLDSMVPDLPEAFDKGGDARDETTWVVVELTSYGEDKVERGILGKEVRRDLSLPSDHPVFIPSVRYSRGSRSTSVHLMEGYVFVASGLPEATYFTLETKPYVKQVMSQAGPSGMRSLSVIDNDTVERMRLQLRQEMATDTMVGDRVEIVDGHYQALEGEVVSIDGNDPEYADVCIEMRSLHVIARIPKVFLKVNNP